MNKATTLTAEQLETLQRTVNDLINVYNGKETLNFTTVKNLNDLNEMLKSQNK